MPISISSKKCQVIYRTLCLYHKIPPAFDYVTFGDSRLKGWRLLMVLIAVVCVCMLSFFMILRFLVRRQNPLRFEITIMYLFQERLLLLYLLSVDKKLKLAEKIENVRFIMDIISCVYQNGQHNDNSKLIETCYLRPLF